MYTANVDVQDAQAIKQISARSSTTLANYSYDVLNAQHILVYFPLVTSLPYVEVTTKVGDTVIINGEQLQFGAIDLVNNYITNLSRGRDRTIINTRIEVGSTVQSVLSRDMMPQVFVDQDWYDFQQGPLQISTTPPARFLQTEIV
jgi:hypothetical protein